MHLHRRSVLQIAQVFEDFLLGLLQDVPGVSVFHITLLEVKRKARTVVRKELVEGDGIGYFCVENDRCFIRPAARHIPDVVPSPPKDKQRDIETLHVVDAFTMAFKCHVEATKPVPGEGVSPTLQNYGTRLKHFHNLRNDRLKHRQVPFVVDAVLKRKVDAVVLAFLVSNIPESPGAGEKITVLMKGHRHDPIRRVEGLFDPIAVVDVYVYVQNPCMVL
mmetsp:Transcript_20327/g.49918  ORF Transcript_20327/g.49918 Transcript_20327/m.49918 type:complete len:219 (-) Transcript_20327:564-1220(-)